MWNCTIIQHVAGKHPHKKDSVYFTIQNKIKLTDVIPGTKYLLGSLETN